VTWIVQEVGGARVIPLARELDAEALPALVEQLEELFSESRLRLVFDLSRCPQVSSNALRLFLQVARRVESQRGAFALAAPTAEVARLLELSGVARLVKVLPSVREAIEATAQRDRLATLAEVVRQLLARAERRGGS